MFVFFAFVIFHVYLSVLISIEEENGLLDSIFSGWKFVPAGELRHEVAAIPEARRFVKRHQLLPRAGPGEKGPLTPRPGPGPVALYRNWISFAGTGIAAVGLFVFVVLTAYHTIGGGALVEPYGDLVIVFRPADIGDCRRCRRADRHVRSVDPVAEAQAAILRALS